MAGVSLQERGWFLSEEGIDQCSSGGKSDVESIIKTALDTDLREIAKGWLPEDINRGHADYVQGPGVLQLQKIRNVSAPKDNEESQYAPRLMKLVLTDGHITCSAVETEVLKEIGSNTAPGSKILLKKTTVGVEHGFLLLNNKNTKHLGGRVEKLAEGWELKKKLSKQQRGSYGTEGGPPPFVPFGQRISNDAYKATTRRDNFKSLDANKGEKKVEDNEFEQQRKATIAEAMQAKEDVQSKKFGGGQKQLTNDYDVAKITEMGFKAEQATSALKINNGNVQQAIDYLLKGGGSTDQRSQGGPNRQTSYESGDRRGPSRQSNYDDRKPQGAGNRQINNDSDRGRGRGKRDRRDDDTGPSRGRRGRDNDDGEEVSSKPSGPATLFDFLAVSNKIPETKDTKDKTSSGKDTSSKNSYDKRERPRTSSGSSDQSNRAKQSVPPRFVNKPKYDQGQNKGQNFYQDDRSQKSREDRPKTAPSENRRYDNRTQSDKNTNDRDRNTKDRNRNYNERNSNDNRDYKRGGGKNEDRNFKQNDRKAANYDSKSNSNNYQRQADNRENSRGNYRQDKGANQGGATYSDNRQKSSDSNSNKSSSRTPYPNERGEQGRSRNQQGQSSQSQNQSSANNSYKSDSYSKGGNSQKSQSNYSANNRGGNSQNYNTGSDNYVQSQQTQSGNYRNYNNYPAMSTSGGQYQQTSEYMYSEQPIPFNVKVGDKVMAKYWEDNLFYEARIEVMTPGLPTAIVSFTEYGNSEEVLFTDIRPYVQQISQQGPLIQADMSVPPPQVFYSGPPQSGASGVEDVIQAFGGMEFRRGGGGAAYPRKDGRGQQQFYQPPPQRR